jgi:hypothetical protein
MSNESKEKPNQPFAAATGSENGVTGAIALLRCLSTREIESAYRKAILDESDLGQQVTGLIRRELIRRGSLPNDEAQRAKR